jgi:hypothetical protein
MTTVINPTLVLTNIRDEDLYSLSLAFSNRLPWLDTILAELQTGRDNLERDIATREGGDKQEEEIDSLEEEIIELEDEILELSEKQNVYYLATPYSKYEAGLHRAFIDASHAAADVMRQGRNVYCPIAHSHSIATYGGIDPYDHDVWLAQDKPFMDAAVGLIVVKMPGWETSYGISEEIKVFTAAGKTIEYMEWPLDR